MMEAARTSETLVNFYQTTRCYNPEDSNLHTHRRENLKSYRVNIKSEVLIGLLTDSFTVYSTPIWIPYDSCFIKPWQKYELKERNKKYMIKGNKYS
jgi:hypothetical protein